MCSRLSPATVGTKRFVFSDLWVRLQRPLYPARCLSSAPLSPMTAVRSPAVKVSLAMMVSRRVVLTLRVRLCRTSYRQPAGRQFLKGLPDAGVGVMSDGRGQVRAN